MLYLDGRRKGERIMYTNIGRKIKGLAKAQAIVMAILCLGAGFVLGVMGVPIFILAGAAAAFIFYIGSWALYGFGQLIESAQRIDEKLNADNNHQTIYTAPQASNTYYNPQPAPPKAKPSVCPVCNAPCHGNGSFCEKCGNKLY